MKKSLMTLFQVLVVLFGIAAVIFMIAEPLFEGRNNNATLFQVYFNDAFLACVYITSISFFMVLYQVFKLFGYAGEGKMASVNSVKALAAIKYSAVSLIISLLVGEAYLFIIQRKIEEDIAGGVAMGLMLIFVSSVVVTVAVRFERLLRNKR
jgi:hypothetical protein